MEIESDHVGAAAIENGLVDAVEIGSAHVGVVEFENVHAEENVNAPCVEEIEYAPCAEEIEYAPFEEEFEYVAWAECTIVAEESE